MTDKIPQARHRTIRSFVRREGRLTASQARAIDEFWPAWGVDYEPATLDFDKLFARQAPRILEIGFGNGETLALQATENPDIDYLGVEVHRPGVGRLLKHIDSDGLSNLRVICHDAVEVLRHQICDAALDGVHIFFPDPWPKKRHHKRRLIQPEFISLLATRMKPGARLHVATDWENYAEHILECLDNAEVFERDSPDQSFDPLTDVTIDTLATETATAPEQAAGERPVTHFERRGRRLGHSVWDFIYLRKPG